MKENNPSSEIKSEVLNDIDNFWKDIHIEEVYSNWKDIHIEEVYSKMKKGKNPSIVFESNLYEYRKNVRCYFKYKQNEIQIAFSREEMMSLIENYLRRIKLEKICSKLVIE
jgi:hypothetical protein